MFNDKERQARWAEASLQHLKIFFDHKEPDSRFFRSLIDNWCAYKMGGGFLEERIGRPVWFNNPNPQKFRDALLKMHFVSDAARKMINAEEKGLVKDHSVPAVILQEAFCAAEIQNLEDVDRWLQEHYAVGLITKYGHDHLADLKLQKEMPPDWDRVDAFARYRAARINGRVRKGFRTVQYSVSHG